MTAVLQGAPRLTGTNASRQDPFVAPFAHRPTGRLAMADKAPVIIYGKDG